MINNSGSIRIGGRLLVGSESQEADAVYDRDTETGSGVEAAEDVASFIHRNIGVVEQSSVALLSGTIAFNIGYGKVCRLLVIFPNIHRPGSLQLRVTQRKRK